MMCIVSVRARQNEISLFYFIWATLFSLVRWRRGGGVDASAALMHTRKAVEMSRRVGDHTKIIHRIDVKGGCVK